MNNPEPDSKVQNIAPAIDLLADIFVDAEGLSGEEVLVGLLDHGLFSEKAPPCFTSMGLAEVARFRSTP